MYGRMPDFGYIEESNLVLEILGALNCVEVLDVKLPNRNPNDISRLELWPLRKIECSH